MSGRGEGMNDFAEWLHEQDSLRRGAGLHRAVVPRGTGEPMLDLASNDYLGLARDPAVIVGAAEALLGWGAGATGSRLVSGSTDVHRDLEESLARLTGAPAALVFSSGYLANIGAITALAGPDCLVVSDSGNHASIIDACRLARSSVAVVGHRDARAVAAALRDRTQRRALVVTDAVFSVDGDLAPLVDLHDAARRHGAVLVVDEAHSLGVIGDGGTGAVAAAGLAREPDVVITATLSKSLGSQGGAVLGSREVRSHLVNRARSFIFDTALAPPAAGAALAAVGRLAAEPGLAKQVRANAGELHRILTELGLTAATPDGAVVSALMPTPESAVRAAQVCAEHGVHVGCFRPPSVPDGVARLRLTARADLTDSDLALARAALSAAVAPVMAPVMAPELALDLAPRDAARAPAPFEQAVARFGPR